MAKTTTNEVTFSKQSTKAGLIEYLRYAYKKGISDQSLKDTILYAGKKFKEDEKKVTKNDLLDLCVKAQKLLENVVPVAPAKKVVAKPVEASTKTGKKSLQLAKFFPPVIVTQGLKFVAAHDKYKNFEEVKEAFDSGVRLVFATYWTKRILKQFSYKDTYKLKNSDPKEFTNDVDLMEVREITDNKENFIIAISVYTDAVGVFFEEEIPPVEDEDEDGDKFSLRLSNGMEFEIYELVTDEEEEPEEPETVEEEPEAEETPEEPVEEEPKPAPKKRVPRRKVASK